MGRNHHEHLSGVVDAYYHSRSSRSSLFREAKREVRDRLLRDLRKFVCLVSHLYAHMESLSPIIPR